MNINFIYFSDKNNMNWPSVYHTNGVLQTGSDRMVWNKLKILLFCPSHGEKSWRGGGGDRLRDQLHIPAHWAVAQEVDLQREWVAKWLILMWVGKWFSLQDLGWLWSSEPIVISFISSVSFHYKNLLLSELIKCWDRYNNVQTWGQGGWEALHPDRDRQTDRGVGLWAVGRRTGNWLQPKMPRKIWWRQWGPSTLRLRTGRRRTLSTNGSARWWSRWLVRLRS